MGKLTDEQLKSIKDATGKMNSILTEVGFLEARKAEYLAAHFEAAKELEVISTQFETILGSAQAAQKQLEELQQFAATTPFQIQGLALATRQLLSFGLEQEKVIPTLRKLGDLAAGTGASIDELTIPFGRLISTQKLTLIELDKFADRGINLFGKLSEQTGISLKVIRDEISKGTIPFSEFERALDSLTQKGGTFFGATEKQSKTLDGVISTLNDNIFNFAATIGKAFSPLIIAGATKLTSTFQSLNEIAVTTSGIIANGFERLPPKLNEVNEEISVLEEKLGKAQKRLEAVGGEKGDFFSRLLGGRDQAVSDIAAINTELAALRETQKELSTPVGTGDIRLFEEAQKRKTEIIREQTIEEKRLEAERSAEKAARLEEEAAQALIRKDDRLILIEEQLGEEEALRLAAEQIRLEANGQFVAAQNNIIASNRKAVTKQQIEDEKKANKARMTSLGSMFDFEKNTNQGRAANFRSTLSTLSALSSSSNKELFAIAKAASLAQATIDGIAAVQKAWSQGGIFGAALSVAVAAATAANIAKIASSKPPSFQNGGVVGGFGGATGGPDNQLVGARTGEMFLNGGQQRNLFEMINQNDNQGGDLVGEMRSINTSIQMLLAKDTVIEVSGRELGRSIRDERERGFAV